MKRFLFALILCWACEDLAIAQQQWTVQWEGYGRRVFVDLPASRPGQTGLPVVFALHGWGLLASEMRDSVTRLHLLGDSVGFITVYPQAPFSKWNSGISDNPSWPVANADDVGFIAKLIDTLTSRFAIDTQRVYASGLSNGGIMCLKLASELSSRIAAVATVGSVMTTSIGTNYSARRPVPVLMINGTADPSVPYYGGVDGWYSVHETMKFWLTMNNCFLPPDSLALPDLDPNDQSTVVRYRYRSSINFSQVVLMKIIGGGHTWPSMYCTNNWGVGPLNMDIKANNETWNFFKQFSRGAASETYAHNVAIDRRYARPGNDSICLTAVLANPLKQMVALTATVSDTLGATRDSVLLYNDGLHGDGSAGDSVWGCRIRAPSDEGGFNVGVVTSNTAQGTVVRLPFAQRFYTSGPIVYKGWVSATSDTVPRPGSVLRLRFLVANAGKSCTVRNVTAIVSTLDTMVFMGTVVQLSYGDLAPGQESPGAAVQALRIQSYCPPNTKARLLMSFSTEGLTIWTDTISIMVQPTATVVERRNAVPTEYSLCQNYPNPFNPGTTIQYYLPKSADVSLGIYNTLGQLVAILVNERKDAGSYQVEWNANVPSGIYFYRLQAGEYLETKKMIFLR